MAAVLLFTTGGQEALSGVCQPKCLPPSPATCCQSVGGFKARMRVVPATETDILGRPRVSSHHVLVGGL